MKGGDHIHTVSLSGCEREQPKGHELEKQVVQFQNSHPFNRCLLSTYNFQKLFWIPGIHTKSGQDPDRGK